jgi:hypothetical protein
MPSYTEEDGRALSKEELVPLFVLGDRYGMRGFMQECIDVFVPFEGYEDALVYLRGAPDSLLWTEQLYTVTKAAGDALAKALGPVEELWQAAEAYDDSVDWMVCYVLDERVTALPIGAIEALLRSEELQLKSENYSFSLALWWIAKQEGTRAEQQPLFNRLLKSLRYARMSAVFLASIASFTRVQKSGLLPSIMARAIWRRDYVPRPEGLQLKLPTSRVKEADRESYSCTFTTHFTRAAIEALHESNRRVSAPLGLLHGHPCRIQLTWKKNGMLCLTLLSEFQRIVTPAFYTPGEAAWEGQDAARRGFVFGVVRGRIGALDIRPRKHFTSTRDSTYLLKWSREQLLYDAEGKLQVEIEIKSFQHTDC